ncbi:MAG: hypothetical protein MUP81_01280, partial [Dehalococcoidia bacterium]|nr:hypothetical protein [Dehalococcoidia bacterium]
ESQRYAVEPESGGVEFYVCPAFLSRIHLHSHISWHFVEKRNRISISFDSGMQHHPFLKQNPQGGEKC